VVVSDQTEGYDVGSAREVEGVIRILRMQGHEVEIHKHLPRRGMAEQRQFLLDQARAPYALFLDDDLILEPWVVGMTLHALRDEGCGFVGCPPVGLSHLDSVRPDEQAMEPWDGPVRPESIEPGGPQWQRYKLHNAANVLHVQQRLNVTPEHPLKYRVAWVGACVLYDVARLRSVGGFTFWHDLPPQHVGEDVLAQLRVMARYGGCGILPSGVYHLELPTTLPQRDVNAPEVLRSASREQAA
jgi:hypothetical protein